MMIKTLVWAYVIVSVSGLHRLQTSLQITKYNIDLDVHFNNVTQPYYYGGVVIEFFVKAKAISSFDLHAKSMNITHINLRDGHHHRQIHTRYILNEYYDDVMIIDVDQPLLIHNSYFLTINYTSNIRDDGVGLYYTEYSNAKKQPIRYLATHFNPNYARYAFPCFDEPALKAVFAISITHPSNYTAISNTHEQTITFNSITNRTTTTFAITDIISTYNVAFIVSDFRNANKTVNGVCHRVFYNEVSDYGINEHLNVSIRVFDELNKLFKNYSDHITKIDHFPIDKPQRRKINRIKAIENAGLIIYDKNNMIAANNVQENLILLAHEMVHLWFGVLVSPQWWVDVWINEGFSTYFSYVVFNMLYPDDGIADTLILRDIDDYIVKKPSSNSIIPNDLEYDDDDDDIVKYFNIGIYFKAAGLIKMISDGIGEKVFMTGINSMLRENAFSTISTGNLINKYHHHNISHIFKNWLYNVGLPTVFIIRNYRDGSFIFKVESPKQQKWSIPINFATASHPNFNNLTIDLILRTDNFSYKPYNNCNVENYEWVIANKQQSGLYSVMYDDMNMKLIIEALIQNHTQIHPTNRALIFRDFGLNLDSANTILIILYGIRYVENETDLHVKSELFEVFLKILKKIQGTDEYSYLVEYLRTYTLGISNGLDLSSHLTYDKIIIYRFICEINLNACASINIGIDIFTKEYNINPIAPHELVCVAFKYIDDKSFEILLNNVVANSTNKYLEYLLNFIPCLSHGTHISTFLSVFLNETETFASSYYSKFYRRLEYVSGSLFARNPISKHIIMDIMMNNYEQYFAHLKGVRLLERMAPYVSEDQSEKVTLILNIYKFR